MQTAIDRVIRSFTFRCVAPLRAQLLDDRALDDRASGAGDEATDMAAQLLANYRGHLAHRAIKAD
jgi:hypothetical protein